MSEIFNQNEVGHCDFIDVLEEAVLAKKPVAITLKSGEQFTDEVQDVVTENHQEFAILRGHGRLLVDDIRSCSRAEPRPGLIISDLPA